MHVRHNNVWCPESRRSKPKSESSPEAADKALLRLLEAAGNEAVARTLRRGSGAVPVQRTIVAGGGDDPMEITTAAKLAQLPGMNRVSDRQFAALAEKAQSHNLVSLADALEDTRNLVVGAVDGVSPAERDFLINAAERYGNLSAYDPAMSPHQLGDSLSNLLAQAEIDPDLLQLRRDSITAFGHHVPHTIVLIPHPGPWVNDDRPHDLASCLEYVLGRSSIAHVLTDNEGNLGYAATLVARIDAINNAHDRMPGYRRLQVQQQTLNVPQAGQSVDVGDVPFQPTHQPNFKVVKISRL